MALAATLPDALKDAPDVVTRRLAAEEAYLAAMREVASAQTPDEKDAAMDRLHRAAMVLSDLREEASG